MMAGFLNYFQWPSLPTSKDTGVGEVATKEANSLVERILEEWQDESIKHKYTHFIPEERAKTAKYAAEFGNTAAVRNFKTYTVVWENFSVKKISDAQWCSKIKHSKYFLQRIIKTTKYLRSE